MDRHNISLVYSWAQLKTNSGANMDRRSFLLQSTAATSFLMGGGLTILGQDAKSASASPVVETTAGKIQGMFQNKVHTFKGVPYGASTAGARRFMPPVKPQPWTDVKKTWEYTTRAPQIRAPGGGLVPEAAVMEWTGPMSEDCLNLNVWTSGIKDGGKRPVMLWLHGGGFARGSAQFTQYDGTNLAAKHNVVVVCVNHRLDILGYLYLADLGGEKYAHSGNVGMQDAVAALEWVRDNIANFGGDPGNVTVFGQSGGGGKVSALLGMPQAKGLFHRAIAMSGSLIRGVRRGDATEGAESVLRRLNIDKSRIDEIQKVPVQQLLELTVSGGRGSGNVPLRLSPVIDGYSMPADPFYPVATEISSNIPLMIGSTETEVTWNANQSYDPLDNAALHNKLKQTLRSDDAATDKVIAVFRKDRPKASNLDLFLIASTTASNFRTGTDTEAERKAAQGKAAVYKYYFQWYSPVREGKLRSMHTMDIPFVFDNVDIGKSTVGEGKERQPLADKMSAAWVAFAKSGNPNHKGLPNWPAFNNNQRPTMVFNNECRMMNDPYREERLAIHDATGGRDTDGA
jgi:para-nitrobenzyl esterase